MFFDGVCKSTGRAKHDGRGRGPTKQNKRSKKQDAPPNTLYPQTNSSPPRAWGFACARPPHTRAHTSPRPPPPTEPPLRPSAMPPRRPSPPPPSSSFSRTALAATTPPSAAGGGGDDAPSPLSTSPAPPPDLAAAAAAAAAARRADDVRSAAASSAAAVTMHLAAAAARQAGLATADADVAIKVNDAVAARCEALAGEVAGWKELTEVRGRKGGGEAEVRGNKMNHKNPTPTHPFFSPPSPTAPTWPPPFPPPWPTWNPASRPWRPTWRPWTPRRAAWPRARACRPIRRRPCGGRAAGRWRCCGGGCE